MTRGYRPGVIEYFHSLSSPWAYLGGPRLHEIAARHRVAIDCRPITVLTENGGIRLRTRPAPRQRYHAAELDRWRRYLGLPLNLEPRFYPTDPAQAGRFVIAARMVGPDAARLSHRILTALWAEERDIRDPATLRACAADCGMDAALLAEVADAPETARAWADNHAEAIARGMFGTPNYLWRGVIHWGQDRLDFLDAMIARDLAVGTAV